MKRLTAVSTFVDDVLLNEQEQVLEVRVGGPAEFFRRVFEKTSQPVQLITGRRMQVRIKVVLGMPQVGRVVDAGDMQSLPQINSPNLLLSSLAREWNVLPLKDYLGRVFLDVQGFVRNPSAGFGRKQVWSEIELIASNLFCIKATELELRFLPPSFVQDQIENRCLLLTKGPQGSEIFFRGQAQVYEPEESLNPPDTLGAGDTYLATFTKEFIQHEDWRAAGLAASQAAFRFLKAKG
ncbi:MAG: hypothetical protein HYV13_02720 [Candidatus Doudnabacteria bacterium]|nr:hypothetical protein [Candidatus Doudnabacteria bacterium]